MKNLKNGLSDESSWDTALYFESQRSPRRGFPWRDVPRAEGEGNQAIRGVSDATSRFGTKGSIENSCDIIKKMTHSVSHYLIEQCHITQILLTRKDGDIPVVRTFLGTKADGRSTVKIYDRNS